MHSAEAATPAPTYGTPASSRRPCTVPSSPNGPWRTGNTTSTWPSVAAGAESATTGSVSTLDSGSSAPARGELPASAAVDLDDDGLVAARVERGDDGTRRLE